MAAFNFPSSPSNGDSHSQNGVTFTYSSSSGAWQRSSAVGAQGATGSTGAQGAAGAQGSAGAQGAANATTISNNNSSRVITGTSTANTVSANANFQYDGTNAYILGSTSGLAVGTNAMVSGRSDNVLHLHKASGGTANGPTIYFTNQQTGVTGSDGFTVGINDAQSPYIWNRENTDLRFGTNNTHRMTLDNDGILKLFNAGNTQDGTFYSSFTINNTGSSTWSRIRFDRSGSARWGLSLRTDDKFAITNLYKNGSGGADDDSFVIENNNRVSINGKISARQYQCPPTLTEDYSVTSSYNEMMIGPITINNGITLTVNTGARLVVL